MTSIECKLVTPSTWTKTMHKDLSRRLSAKDRSTHVISQLYPKIDLRASKRARIQHDGLIDAILIARYGLEINQ